MISVLEYLILFCVLWISETGAYQRTYRNNFGEAYGNEWIFISDNRGAFHFVNLTDGSAPSSRSAIRDINISLYTRKNTRTSEDLSEFADMENQVVNKKPKSIYLDSRLPIKIITHGWMSSGESDTVINIKDAYLKKYDVNVIAVDWANIADNYFYPLAAVNTRIVGKYIAKLLNTLYTHYNVHGDQIHLIGHSLGAHVMGVAAAQSKQKISRVTGLDPARPLFEAPFLINDSLRLDKNDADLVDAIHTCAGILGFSDPLGDVDFYPNGGFPGQPGCDGFQAIIESCSHGRSHQYFAASILSPAGYKAYKCDSWDHFTKGLCRSHEEVVMGDALQWNITGTFYLYTFPPPHLTFN